MMQMRGAVPNQMNPGQPVMGMQNYMQRPQGQVSFFSLIQPYLL